MTIPFDRKYQRPNYPAFGERGYPNVPHVPPDLWPSGLGPGAAHYSGTFGRHLAGADTMDAQQFDGQNAEGMDVYPNELDSLTAADDTAGNGLFDPNDTHGNIHPEDGIFQDHQSLPGYVSREIPYKVSEVRDLTRPDGYTMYVPGGAVSLQQGQQHTLTQNSEFWQLPPGVNPIVAADVPDQSIVDAPTATNPVSGGILWNEPDQEKRRMQYLLAAAGVGLLGGVIYFATRKKKGRR